MKRLLIGFGLALVSLPAWAQLMPGEWERCQGVGSGANVPAEARIGYCTQLIQSGQLSTANMPRAYLNRGRADYDAGHYDNSIADISQSIALFPRPSFDAYNNRAAAYEKKGQRDRAIADFRAALRIDPNNDFAKRSLTRLGATP